jgi:hypothetical protein
MRSTLNDYPELQKIIAEDIAAIDAKLNTRTLNVIRQRQMINFVLGIFIAGSALSSIPGPGTILMKSPVKFLSGNEPWPIFRNHRV